MASYTLLPEDLSEIPQSWFDTKLSQRRQKTQNKALVSFYEEEVRVLRSYHDGELQADAAAEAVTRPISSSPVPELGGYSDDSTALCHLWALLVNALIEWPSGRTPSLAALLSAVSRVPTQIHRGEALDDDDQPLLWNSLPFFTMVWSDAHWMQPGMITRRASDEASRSRGRRIYIKQQDVEARLVAAGLLKWKLAFQYLITALERKPGPEDRREAENDGQADGQLKLDFHVAAAARWMEHDGERLYAGLVEDELQSWNERDIPVNAMKFESPTERWAYWEHRLGEIEREESDDFAREAARKALGYMQHVKEGSKMKE
ncbi:hypothetical protein PG984_011501 [Apiospora sp. TS-2023a]